MSDAAGISRRRFVGYVLAAPTLATTARWLGTGTAAGAQTVPAVGLQVAESVDLIDLIRLAAQPTANLIRIDVGEDGTVSFDLHRTEVGQGINTAVAMVIAEEMGVPVESVRIRQADARPELLFNQLTGGSNSMYTIYEPVRIAAAVARQRLLQAAGLLVGSLTYPLDIVDGLIRTPDGRSLGIGDLAREAASTVTEVVDAEPRSGARTVVGTPRNRIDARAMVTGQQAYVADLDIPDALPTMVARPPTVNGRPLRVRNTAAVLDVTGVTDVAVLDTGVAIRARTFGQCIDALQIIEVEWEDGPAVGLDDDAVDAELARSESPIDLPDLPDVGRRVSTMEESFTFAFQPNCPLEPNPAIADVRDGKAEIWAPLKSPIVAQQDIALALGLPPGAVTCHVVQGGGSFGRDLFWDAAREAALASQAMGKPVKLMYTRTDDFRHGRVHPASRSTIRLAHTATDIVGYAQHHTSVNTDFGHGFGDLLTAVADELPLGLGGLTFSQTIFLLTQYVPYNFGPVSQTLAETLPRVLEARNNIFRTSSMRNIYSPNVVTARELMIDRAAATMGRDPLELRLAAARDDRSKAVLTKVAEAGEWGRPMEPGTAQGLGFHSEYKGRAACLIEIDCRPETVQRQVPTAKYAYTGPRVTKAIYAVDVGLAINPRGLEAQMIGGMMDGIANALSYSLHLRDGAFAEDSWEHAYYTRQWNTPFETQVFVIPSSDQPGGAGEFGVAATMAATATAYARATGTMPTRFPINHDMPLAETIVPQGTIPQSPIDGLAGIR
jgi:isoquinoline 1-oxidoreductase subunit beta